MIEYQRTDSKTTATYAGNIVGEATANADGTWQYAARRFKNREGAETALRADKSRA